MHPNETRIYLTVLSGVLILVVLIVFFMVTIMRYHRRKVATHFASIKEQINYLESERERIAADLHDDFGAGISAVKIRMQSMKNLSPANESIITFSKLHMDGLMQRLRETSFNLMPRILQREGLDEALQDLIDLMTHPLGIKVKYEYNLEQLDKEKSLHIYRIAQEVLNNIVKHSEATAITFTISSNKKNIVLQVTDNGKGFNKNRIKNENRGSGLKNIVARADLLKAKIYLTTAQNKGVQYQIVIPL